LVRLSYLDVAVLGSLDRHDMKSTRKYLWAKIRRTYDESSMLDRLGKHDPHTYNQPTGCIVDTWW